MDLIIEANGVTPMPTVEDGHKKERADIQKRYQQKQAQTPAPPTTYIVSSILPAPTSITISYSNTCSLALPKSKVSILYHTLFCVPVEYCSVSIPCLWGMELRWLCGFMIM